MQRSLLELQFVAAALRKVPTQFTVTLSFRMNSYSRSIPPLY